MLPSFFTRSQGLRKLYCGLFTPMLERRALTQLEVDILLFLANNPAYDTARDIVERRHLAKSHVSAGIEALAGRGLLERWKRADNRKTIHLRLTEAAGPVVAEGRASGQYLQDVGEETPYQEDILLLYDWGIAGGAVGTGAFQPGDPISRCQAAAMVARLAYEERRLTLDWEILPAYSRKGTSMGDLVHSDGTFYEAPALDDAEKIDADVRYMLSRGQRELTLNYPANTLTNADISHLLSVFLDAVRQYVEQTYNYISVSFSLRTGYVQLTFSSSLYDESQTEFYREETMEYAVAVHDWMWETGQVTADMTEYDKARVYFAWICESCRYDHTYEDMSHSAYRLFDEGIAVCDGYTAAYNLLLKLEGIDCGTWSAADHIWTTAELDGHTYHIDTTWGDQTYGVEYRYFAMTEADAVSRF
jgi:DNA-binding MarR family transcriptional regulator